MTQKMLRPKLIFSFILLAMLFFCFNIHSLAVDITEGDRVLVVDNNTIVSSKYKFIPEFNKSKTTAITFGMPATDVTTKSGSPYFAFNPGSDTSLKGKFGVIYKNVGNYNGKSIDLKITVLDWSKYSTNNTGKICFPKTSIGENPQGYYYIDQKWEFFESGTDNKIQTSGYLTINDIDSLQGIKFDKTTSSAMSNILVDPSAKGFLSYSNTNGEINIYENNGRLSENNDLFAMATILYDNLDTIRFKWERDFNRSTTSASKIYPANNADGEYFGYIAKKPARTELLDPLKAIEVDGQEAEEMKMAANKTFNFNLYHQVPDEWQQFYYANYSITDTIDNHLDIQSIRVFNEQDADVTDYFDNQTSGNSINLVAKTSTLQMSSFYKHTYKVEVKVKAKDSDYTNIAKDGQVTLSNIFSVTKDGVSKTSNPVKVHLLPLVEVNLKHIQIYTGNAKKGLPVKLDLTVDYPFGRDLPELGKKSIKIGLYEKNSNTALISQEYKLNNIPTKITDWIIPPNNLVKDTHKNYEVRISGIDNLYIISRNPEINTDGYTASEKAFNVDAGDTNEVSYKGVVMTEREINKEMEIHYETLKIPIRKIGSVKSGYGIEMNQEINYTNELTVNDVGPFKTQIVVDPKLVDGDYKLENDKVYIDLLSEESIQDGGFNQILKLPKVYVEDKTGKIFSEKQKAEGDNKYTLYDGGNKLYVPIWIDKLGDYSYAFQSKEPVGLNQVTFKINDKINVYAYMYGYIGSETIDKDEILIEPVDTNDPFPKGLPKGWNSNDLNWLKK